MGMIKKKKFKNKKTTLTNVGNSVEQLEPLLLASGNVKWYGSFENLAIQSIVII